MAKIWRNFAKHVPSNHGQVTAPEQKIQEEFAEFAPWDKPEWGPYYKVKEPKEIIRRREEGAVRHSESKDDPDEPEDDDFIS